MRLSQRCSIAAALLCGALSASAAQIAVPPYSARVVDLTGTLSSEQLAALEQRLRAFEERKGSQLAVLIVPTTEPEDIAEFGIRVGESWKSGRKRVDDGAILLVAKDDRRMRIEVGYGLEGALPDAIAKRIIEEVIAPHFKRGDFYGGIDAGLEQMMKVVDGEPLPEPDRGWSSSSDIGGGLIVALVLTFIGATTLRVFFGRTGGALATGGVVGVVTYIMTRLLPFAVVFAIAGFVVAMLFGAFGGPRGWSSGGRHGGGGWTGGWGGSSGGGFGGGGGGFGGGGGGGFGGGGASGSW